MADTEIDIPPYSYLSEHEKAMQDKASGAHMAISAIFMIVGAGCFFGAFMSVPPDATIAHHILAAVLTGVGFLCWGIAWVGAILNDRL